MNFLSIVIAMTALQESSIPWWLAVVEGIPYGVTPNVSCGRGEYKLCHNPRKHGSWDGMHPSEAVYKAIAMGLLRGSYTQPPFATTAYSCTHLSELGFSIEYKSI